MSERALIEAATHVCWQQEAWAHAEFCHGMNAGQRRELGAPGPRPWRGIMNPGHVHLINVLEEMNLYDAPVLAWESADV